MENKKVLSCEILYPSYRGDGWNYDYIELKGKFYLDDNLVYLDNDDDNDLLEIEKSKQIIITYGKEISFLNMKNIPLNSDEKVFEVIKDGYYKEIEPIITKENFNKEFKEKKSKTKIKI